MDGYRSAYKRNQTVPDIKSDPVVKDRLLGELAIDPGAFSKRDLSREMSKLSPKDFEWFRGKQRAAIGDLSKAVREGSVYNDGLKAAKEFYGAAGIATTGKAANTEANAAKRAQYHAAIKEKVDEYVAKNQTAPPYEEVRKIAAALSLSLIGSETRGAWSPMRLIDDGQDDVVDAHVYERSKLNGLNVRPNVSFSHVPVDMVEPIRGLLKRQGMPNPTNTQIADEWGRQAIAIIGAK
jgi:hypothetical protein